MTPAQMRRQKLAQPHELYEQTLGALYDDFLRRGRKVIDQQHIAQALMDAGARALTLSTWRVWLSRLRNDAGGIPPGHQELHVIADQLQCSAYDERRLLRAADYYPTDEELAVGVHSARDYVENLTWPAVFIDYRLGILGWNSALAQRFGLGQAVGPDLALLPANAADRPHLLYALWAPDGFLHPVLEQPTSYDAVQLMTLVRAYWEPQTLWSEARRGWMRSIERKCATFSNVIIGNEERSFDSLWREADALWHRHTNGPFNALTDSPAHNIIHISRSGLRFRLLPFRVDADPRVEWIEFQEMPRRHDFNS